MTTYGLGVDDASQALTVSRAVKRAMTERGLSAAEAIDDLSSKLDLAKLVTCGVHEETPAEEEQAISTSRPSSPQQQRAAPTPPTACSDRVSSQPRKRKANAKTGHKNGKLKALKGMSSKTVSRKRPPPSNDDKQFSSRERADSVTEAVEAKAKKARLSPEDSPSPEVDPTIIVRSKRTTLREQQDAQSNTV